MRYATRKPPAVIKTTVAASLRNSPIVLVIIDASVRCLES
jgi:hypothetical protein